MRGIRDSSFTFRFTTKYLLSLKWVVFPRIELRSDMRASINLFGNSSDTSLVPPAAAGEGKEGMRGISRRGNDKAIAPCGGRGGKGRDAGAPRAPAKGLRPSALPADQLLFFCFFSE